MVAPREPRYSPCKLATCPLVPALQRPYSGRGGFHAAYSRLLVLFLIPCAAAAQNTALAKGDETPSARVMQETGTSGEWQTVRGQERPKSLSSAPVALELLSAPLFFHRVGANRRRAIVRIGKDSVEFETL